MDQAWTEAKKQLREKLGHSTYSIWIDRISLNDYGDDWVLFETPNNYFSDYVWNNFKNEIIETLSKIVGKNIELQLQSQDQRSTPRKIIAKARPTGITSEKQFKNFVVGKCNEFAHAAALAVAESPGDNLYNPLFIYGGTGLGKTHLLHAIGNLIYDENPETEILYVTAEQFINEYIHAIRHKQFTEFHAKYRDNCQLLLMDDVQFVSGKDRTQEQLFHIFESLKKRGRQIVFTADMLPKEIKGLEPRLQTRFQSGMLADTQPPDIETMIAILQQKSEDLGLSLSNDLSNYIATGVRGSIRELEGILNKLVVTCKMHNTQPSLAFIRLHFDKLLYHEKPQLQPEDIIRIVATAFGITANDITSSRRPRNITRARHIAMWLVRKHTNLSFPDIGKKFGGRDHASIQYACNKITNQLKKDPDIANMISLLERNLTVSSKLFTDKP